MNVLNGSGRCLRRALGLGSGHWGRIPILFLISLGRGWGGVPARAGCQERFGLIFAGSLFPVGSSSHSSF